MSPGPPQPRGAFSGLRQSSRPLSRGEELGAAAGGNTVRGQRDEVEGEPAGLASAPRGLCAGDFSCHTPARGERRGGPRGRESAERGLHSESWGAGLGGPRGSPVGAGGSSRFPSVRRGSRVPGSSPGKLFFVTGSFCLSVCSTYLLEDFAFFRAVPGSRRNWEEGAEVSPAPLVLRGSGQQGTPPMPGGGGAGSAVGVHFREGTGRSSDSPGAAAQVCVRPGGDAVRTRWSVRVGTVAVSAVGSPQVPWCPLQGVAALWAHVEQKQGPPFLTGVLRGCGRSSGPSASGPSRSHLHPPQSRSPAGVPGRAETLGPEARPGLRRWGLRAGPGPAGKCRSSWQQVRGPALLTRGPEGRCPRLSGLAP